MAEIGNTAIFSQTDGNNNSGTVPTWAEGMAPSQVNDSGRAFQGSVTREWNWRNVTLTSGGSANAQTLTYAVSPAALYNGQTFAFIAGFTNSGAMTLNVNGLGATSVKKDVSGTFTTLSGNEVNAGSIYLVVYNTAGTCFVLIGSSQGVGDTFSLSDDGATEGPTRYLDRKSASPAASDILGAWAFKGRSSTAVERVYARIRTTIKTATNAAEDGLFAIRTMLAGTEADRVIIGGGIYTAGATGGDKGANTINATDYYQAGKALFRGMLVRTTDDTIATDTVLSADSEMQFSMLANTDYVIRGVIMATYNSLNGIKLGITGPTIGTGDIRGDMVSSADTGGTVTAFFALAYGQVIATTPAGVTNAKFFLDFVIRNGANAGTFAITTSQNVSNASTTNIKAGSYIEYKVI